MVYSSNFGMKLWFKSESEYFNTNPSVRKIRLKLLNRKLVDHRRQNKSFDLRSVPPLNFHHNQFVVILIACSSSLEKAYCRNMRLNRVKCAIFFINSSVICNLLQLFQCICCFWNISVFLNIWKIAFPFKRGWARYLLGWIGSIAKHEMWIFITVQQLCAVCVLCWSLYIMTSCAFVVTKQVFPLRNINSLTKFE